MINATLVGRIGRDVEVKYTKSGKPVATINLAVDYGRPGPESGTKPTQWYECSLWDARAEKLAPYLTKGTQVCMSVNDLHIEHYETDKGARAKLVCRVADVALLSGRSEGKQEQAPAPRQQAKPAKQNDDFEDDLPF